MKWRIRPYESFLLEDLGSLRSEQLCAARQLVGGTLPHTDVCALYCTEPLHSLADEHELIVRVTRTPSADRSTMNLRVEVTSSGWPIAS